MELVLLLLESPMDAISLSVPIGIAIQSFGAFLRYNVQWLCHNLVMLLKY